MLPESATAVLRALERGIENDRGTRQADGRLSFTMGGRDHLEQLARMLIFGPSVQDGWHLLLDAIADPTVFAERKRGALLLLTHYAEQVPEDVRLPLHEALSTVLAQQPGQKSPYPAGFDEPIAGAVDIAWLEFHPDREDIAADLVARLLSAEETKADCASFLGLHPGWELVLVALLADQDLRVSKNAAESLAIRVARTPDDAPDWASALLASVSRGGEAIAAAITRGLSHPGALIAPAPCRVVEILAALTTNESPAVRRTAQRLLDERTSAGL